MRQDFAGLSRLWTRLDPYFAVELSTDPVNGRNRFWFSETLKEGGAE